MLRPRAHRAAAALLALAALTALPACASSLEKRIAKAQHAFYAGDVDRAAEILREELEDDPDAPGADVLRLELASALQAAGRYAEAGDQLIRADNSLELLDYTDAPVREVGYALFTTPRPRWRASRPEKLMVNVQNMVNFLGAGDWERAAVEARRARVLMLQSDLSSSERYESGLAWALAGVSLQLAGRHGESQDCFRAAGEQRLPGGPDPASLALEPGPGQGSVLVLVQNGKAPVRAPADYYLFLHDGLHRLEIPALAARSGGWGRAVVTVDGAAVGEAPLLLDLAAQASHRWDDEFPRLLAAAALQLVPRALVGTALREGLESKGGKDPTQDSWAWLAGFLSEELIAEALPTDTRCWSLLPRDVRALRLSVPAGEHTVGVRLIAAPNHPEQFMEWSVTVDEGGFALVNAVTSTLEGWQPLPPPRGGDVTHTAAGQQALTILEAALAWREVVRD